MVASHNRHCGRTNYCYYLGGAELAARGILLLYVELRDIQNFLLIITVGVPGREQICVGNVRKSIRDLESYFALHW